MRTDRRWLVLAGNAVWFALLAGLTGCQLGGGWQAPRPVRIEGGRPWMSVFPSSLWQTGKDAAAAGLLLRDGDLVVGDLWVPYRATDGAVLNLSVADGRATLAGRVVTVEPHGWSFLATATPAQLADLRCVVFPETIEPGQMDAVNRLAAANPHVMIMLESPGPVAAVLDRFEPEMLAIGAKRALTPEDRQAVVAKASVRTLVFIGRTADAMDLISRMPGLRRVLIQEQQENDQAATQPAPGAGRGPAPFVLPGNAARIESLSLWGTHLSSLASLANATELRELTILGDKSLRSIEGIDAFRHLHTLILNGCEGVTDLGPLHAGVGVKLRRLGLPPTVSQTQFAKVIADHPDLAVVEAIGCDGITDLSPLRGLNRLEGLILMGPQKDLGPVKQIKSLRYLAYGEADKGNSEGRPTVPELAQAMPGAMVVTAAPLCLGSGWLLLLPPLVAAAWLWRNRRRWRTTRVAPIAAPRG